MVDAVNFHATQLHLKSLGLLVLELNLLAPASHIEVLPSSLSRLYQSTNLLLGVELTGQNSRVAASSLLLNSRVDFGELTSREVLPDFAWQDDPVLVVWIVLALQVWHPVFVDVETDCAWAVLARCERELASAE